MDDEYNLDENYIERLERPEYIYNLHYLRQYIDENKEKPKRSNLKYFFKSLFDVCRYDSAYYYLVKLKKEIFDELQQKDSGIKNILKDVNRYHPYFYEFKYLEEAYLKYKDKIKNAIWWALLWKS